MAQFSQRLLDWTLKFEGGYRFTNIVGDAGGATFAGITLNDFEEAAAAGIESDFNKDGHVDVEDLKVMPKEAVEHHYCRKYWCSRNLGSINSDLISWKLFDLGVNMGLLGSTLVTQKALVLCGYLVSVDGQLGPQTISGINKQCETRDGELDLLAAICVQAAKRYQAIIDAKPVNQKFAKGWAARANAIPPVEA